MTEEVIGAMSSLNTVKEKRYVGVRETALYGVANGG